MPKTSDSPVPAHKPMTEETVFGRKRFVPGSMLRFGFVRTEDGYRYETDFMNGDFSAVLLVSDRGGITGTVIDRMNGEEYRQLRIDGFQGAYVNTVRAAYEELLRRVADECCTDVPFASDQANRIAGRIAKRFGVGPDFPWEQSRYRDCGVFRHGDSAKWFALIMNVRRGVLLKNGDTRTVDVINLKADPEKIGGLTGRPGVYPAYHMNRRYWITIALDDSLGDEDVMPLVEESFRLTEKNKAPARS